MASGGLGRRVPTDWKHVERFALAAVPLSVVTERSPCILGVNWYREFDHPALDSRGLYWAARDGKLTTVRGGHCICVPDRLSRDREAWWPFYDQGDEGACVGFGSSRAMTLLNRKRFYARWLWDRAKATDEWADTNPGDDNGSSVRAAMEILRVEGHVRWSSGFQFDTLEQRDGRQPDQAEGIAAYRWATSADQVRAALTNRDYELVGGVPFLNSWGRVYPRRVWITWEVLDRLISEDGEAALVTDR